ncbi:Ubiquitin domain-containing protein ubfd1, variant 2 [Mucor circinelloides]
MISFEIKWGAKRFDIELSQEEFDTVTVSDVKSKCQQLTKVEPQFMKLIVKGAILKDDAQLIKDTKIGQGSKVMLMGGSKTHISVAKTPPKADAPIATRLQWTRNLRESVLRPDIKRYEKQVNEHLSQSSLELTQTNQLINYGNYMHEKLMHILQQLDTMPEVNDKERIERKENVKDTEALLDLIESIKAKLTNVSK